MTFAPDLSGVARGGIAVVEGHCRKTLYLLQKFASIGIKESENVLEVILIAATKNDIISFRCNTTQTSVQKREFPTHKWCGSLG